MNNYEKFLAEVLHHINDRLDAGTEAHLRKIQKNNNRILDGLVISTEGSNISPTIYLNDYYEEFTGKQLSLEEIVNHVLEQYEHARSCQPADVSDFADFACVKDRIIFRVINRRKNADLLKRIPHIDYLDLAITFLYLLTIRENADATILIHNTHLSLWHTDTDELFALAQKNTPRLLTWDVTPMKELLSGLSVPDDDLAPRPQDLAYPMYVLTNQNKLHGAGCILYDHLLASLSEDFDDDFYILPSSIHEVLLIPGADTVCRSDLDEMVREVNATQVPEEEILSDHAYLYSREKGEIVY